MSGRSGGASVAGAGTLLVLLTAVVSGVSTFVNSYAPLGTGTDVFVTVRNVLVALALVPFVLLLRPAASAPLSRRDWGRLVAIGVIGGGVPFLLFFHGLALAAAAGGAATASFGYRTLFLFATVLGVVVLRERLHLRIVAAAGLLLLGNVLLLGLTSPVLVDGTAFVMAATGLWAVEYMISKRALADLPTGTVALGRMGIGALVLVGYLGATAQLGRVAEFGPTDWAWIGLSAVLLLAFVASWYAGLKRVDLGVAASALVLGFPITFALTFALRGGPLALPPAVGAAIVTAGVAMALGAAALRATARAVKRRLVGTPAAVT